MIKLTKILFALSLLVMATACNNDDDSDTDTGDLIGTWVAVSFDGDIESSTTFDGTSTTSEVDILGSNLNYKVTFTETAWTTSGGYDVTTTSTVNGMNSSSSTSSNTAVSGVGTYSTDGNLMTIDGSFFEFESNGVPVAGTSGPQEAMFEINSDGELVFSQDEETSTDQNGVMSTNKIKTNSTWKRE